MLAMEEILFELYGDDRHEQGGGGGLPPGFRFHPTDEELLTFYLASKVLHSSFCGVQIAEVDLNRCEPWELPEGAKMGDREWYFFSLRDRKYPSGLRTNRATGAGYWKATGKDREVYSGSSGGGLVGMKKTLVFYKGRAPRGEKTKWVMHEYRLHADFSHRHECKEEWVICRIFHKIAEKKIPLLQGQSYMFNTCNNPFGFSPTNPAGTLPHLLETSTTTQLESQSQNPMTCLENSSSSPFLIHHQESDLKILISQGNNQPLILPMNNHADSNGFEPSFSTTSSSTKDNIKCGITSTIDSSTSVIFKPLNSSHQDFCNLKELSKTIAKQCRTQPSFFQQYCQLSDVANMQMPSYCCWGNKSSDHHQSTITFHNNTFPFVSMDGDAMGLVSSSASAAVTDAVNEMSTSANALSRAELQMLLENTPINISGGDSWPLTAL